MLHLKLSTDPTVGLVDLRVDGAQKVLLQERTLLPSGGTPPSGMTGPGMGRVSLGYYSQAAPDHADHAPGRVPFT